jgi:Uracil DNA glycosylase superfamily
VTFANKVLTFYSALRTPDPVPAGVTVMNPYIDKDTFAICKRFYSKYYNDMQMRIPILGINPGRFGGGVTGIPFTDPVKLEEHCGIKNDLDKRAELSADFVYQVIEAFGGPTEFYGKFYVGAVCPLGFTKDGRNLNYYDLKLLEESLHDFINDAIGRQLDFPLSRECCYCLGEGKNFKYLSQFNRTHAFFKKVVPLPHPRFIMQYRRKKVNAYVERYLEALGEGF